MRISDWSSDVCSSDLGLVRRLEVVEIDPVGRHGLAAGFFAQQALHHRALAGSGRPEHAEIVAVVPSGRAETDRFQRSLLADDLVKVPPLFAGPESEARDVAAPMELFRRPRAYAHGVYVSLPWVCR